jgi:hypothetical protein
MIGVGTRMSLVEAAPGVHPAKARPLPTARDEQPAENERAGRLKGASNPALANTAPDFAEPAESGPARCGVIKSPAIERGLIESDARVQRKPKAKRFLPGCALGPL